MPTSYTDITTSSAPTYTDIATPSAPTYTDITAVAQSIFLGLTNGGYLLLTNGDKLLLTSSGTGGTEYTEVLEI